MKQPLHAALLAAFTLVGLSACGGGQTQDPAADGTPGAGPQSAGPTETAAAVRRSPSPSPSPSPAPGPSPSPSPGPGADIADSQRIAAATATAQSTTNACNPVRPFYWEIGNKSGPQASGSITSPTSSTKYTATMPMSVASASKWIYGTTVVQRQGGVVSDNDRKFLSMRAGYVSFSSCNTSTTVDNCLAYQKNGVYSASADGKFYYGGGHMEKHASLIGLGAANDATLTQTAQGQVGSDVTLTYTEPQLAGGLAMAPSAYALVLRKILSGQLLIANLLGTGAVCTNPKTCGAGQAMFTPIPTTESWHYSVAHWVEDDPVVGDGSFSSPGAFGFYPWIDASKTYYGVLARVAQNGAFPSVQCGRMIRKAWLTGVSQ